MDQIQEFFLEKYLGEQSYTISKDSHVLSARLDNKNNMIIIDILIDLDNPETVEKHFRVFTKNSLIEDNIKADFIGTVVDNENDEVYYVFEKIR